LEESESVAKVVRTSLGWKQI